MATLSGNKIKDTYQSLVKFSDNGNITTSAKQLTDGFGNNSPLYLSTTQIGIGVTPEATYDLHVYSNAKVGGNLTITGDLTVNGTTTTIDTQTLTVEDPLIEVASDNTSTDVVDIGWYGKYAPSGTTLYAGMFRDTGDGKFKIFKSLEEQPTTTVNTSGTGYTVATLVANLEGNVTGGSITATTGLFTDNVNIAGTLVIDDELTVEGSAFGRIEIGGPSGGYIDLKAPHSDDYDLRLITSTGGGELLSKDTLKFYTGSGTDLALTIDTSQDATFEGEIILKDNKKIKLGTDSDLEIYHDGGNGFIKNTTGQLNITDSIIALRNQADNENMLYARENAQVELYYDNSIKLATTNTGISVTGIISNLTDPSAAQDAATKNYVDTQISANNELSEVLANGNTSGANDIIMADSQKVNYGTGSDLQIYHDATDSYIKNDTGNLIIEQTTDDADIIFKNDNGSGDTIEYFRIDGSESRIVYGRSIHMADNVSIFLGNDDDGLIRYDSTANKILYTGTSQFSNDLTVVGDFTVDTDTLFVDSTNSQVGINNSSPSGFTDQYAKDLVIGDGTGDRGITIYSSSSAYGSLFFKDAEGSSTGNGGFIAYNHFTDGMELGIGNAGLGAGSLSIGSTSVFTNKKLIVDATFSSTNTLTVDPANVRVGIFNDSPSYRLDVAGDARFTGQAIVSSDLTVDTDTLFVDASEDSVGIGLTNPADYTVDDLVISVPDDGGMTLVSASTDTAYIAFHDSTGTIASAGFISYDHNTDTLTNFAQSKVSIAILEAEVAYFTDTAFYVDKNTTIDGNSTFTGQVIASSSSSGDYVRMYGGSGTAQWDIYGNGENLRISENSGGGGHVDIDTNLVVDGNVGIGTSPNTKLNIRSDASDDGILLEKSDGTDIARLFHDGTSTNARFDMFSGGSATVQIKASGDTHFSGGNVGIGTSTLNTISGTNPTLTLGGTGISGGLILQRAGTDKARLYENAGNMVHQGMTGVGHHFYVNAATQAMVIDSSGNVGINETSLTEKLEVNGAIVWKGALTTSKTSAGVLDRSGDDLRIRVYGATAGSGNLVFRTGGGGGSVDSEAMRIDSSGTVTITNSSSAVLKLQAGTNSSASLRLINDAHDWDVNCQTNDKFAIYSHTDATERLVILPTSGNVGIGTNNPTKKLTVFGTGAGNATVQIEGEGGADPYINFLANNAQHWSLGIDDSDSDKFKLSEHSALGTNDYLVVDTSGNVIVGGTSYNGVSGETGFEIYGDTAQFLLNNPTYNHFTIYSAGDSNIYNVFGDSGNYLIGTGNKDTSSWSEKMRIESDGTVRVKTGSIVVDTAGQGIYLGGTAVANNLDDYEEGTWTPQVYYQNTTDQANATNVVQEGKYTKIGNLVYVSFRLDFSQSGTPANDNIGVKNLPFAGANNHYGAGGNLVTTTSIVGLNFQLPTAGSTQAVIIDSANGGNYGNEFGTGSGKFIRGSFTYQA